MERLKETSRLFLRDAGKDLMDKKYATCIVHLHMAAEHMLKAYLLKLGEEIQFKTLLDVANRLSTLSIIDKDELKNLSKMNTLRNRIYHEGYLPTGHEASVTLSNVTKVVTDLLSKL